MIRLEQALLDRTRLSEADLAKAESRRAEMGGRLETALLELGLASEAELAPALAAHYSLPAATAEDVKNISESVRALLSREQAGTYNAVPFAAAPGRVDLAVGAAPDLVKADELAFLLGRRVRFFIVNEVRVAQALQRYYGQAQPARLLNLADRLDRGLGPSRDLASDGGHVAEVAPPPMAGTFGAFGSGAGHRSPSSGLGIIRRVTPTKPREELQTVALSDDERQAIFGPDPEPAHQQHPDFAQVPASDLARLSHDLQAAGSPTAVGEAFLAYLDSFFEAALLFRPEGELFCGWIGGGAVIDRSELREMMTGPTLANEWRDLARETEAVSYPIGPSSIAIGLHSALAVEEDAAILLIPVQVQGRIVCLAACAPDKHLEDGERELLGNASLRTGLALQSWILRQKTLSNTPS